MQDIVVIGAGKIGTTVAGLLAATGDYQITLADLSPDVLDRLDRVERIETVAADVEDSSKLLDLVNGKFAVVNAAPFHLTAPIAEAAKAARTLLILHGLPVDAMNPPEMTYRVMADDPTRRESGKRDVLAAITGREIVP